MKDRDTLTEAMFYVLMSFLHREMCRNRDHGICRAENTRPRAARPRNALHAAGKVSG